MGTSVKTAPAIDLTTVLVNISSVMENLVKSNQSILEALQSKPVATTTKNTKSTKSTKTEKAAEVFLVTPEQAKAVKASDWNLFKSYGAKLGEDGKVLRVRNDRGFMVAVQDEKSPINGDDRRWAYGLGKTAEIRGTISDAQIAPAQRLLTKLITNKLLDPKSL